MARETKRFDAAAFINTPDDAAYLLSDALESGHAGQIANVLGVLARAKGMTAVAKETGINRTALYASLSENGNPSLETLLKVAAALKIRLFAAPEVAA
jgi:probable addiction module antidote protein